MNSRLKCSLSKTSSVCGSAGGFSAGRSPNSCHNFARNVSCQYSASAAECAWKAICRADWLYQRNRPGNVVNSKSEILAIVTKLVARAKHCLKRVRAYPSLVHLFQIEKPSRD